MKVRVFVPDDAGVYVNVNDVVLAVGVTVTMLVVVALPTDGIKEPPELPSESVIVSFPLNVPPLERATVKFVED